MISRAISAAQAVQPFLLRLARAHRDADADVRIVLVAGDSPETERVERILGVSATSSAGQDDFAIYPYARATAPRMLEELARRVRRGEPGSALLVGPRDVRQSAERALARARVGVSSTIQVPTLEGRYANVAARGIAKALGRDRVSAGRRYPRLRPVVGDVIIRDSAKRAGLAGALPLPGADLPALFAIQFNMIIRLAALHEYELDADRLLEVGVVGGSAFAFREIARSAAVALPGAGWAVRGGVAYTATRALGEAARLRFEGGGDIVPQRANSAVARAIAGVTGR